MPRATRQLETPDATAAFARSLASILLGGDVLALHGDLGAGKTTLVRDLAKDLGAPDNAVHSPTFVMANEYPLAAPSPATSTARRDAATSHHPATAARRLLHLDAYRLGGLDDLDSLGWDTFMDVTPSNNGARAKAAAPDAIVVIEWAERIAAALPAPDVLASLTLTPTGEDSREIELDLPDSWSTRPGLARLLERDPTRCRITGRWVEPTSPTYPFFDERAKLADLGRWFGGAYTTSREVGPEDLDE